MGVGVLKDCPGRRAVKQRKFLEHTGRIAVTLIDSNRVEGSRRAGYTGQYVYT